MSSPSPHPHEKPTTPPPEYTTKYKTRWSPHLVPENFFSFVWSLSRKSRNSPRLRSDPPWDGNHYEVPFQLLCERQASMQRPPCMMKGTCPGQRVRASLQQPDPANSSFNRELRVRASSPLLGRNSQSNQSSARHSLRPPMPMESSQMHNPGSTAGFAHDLNFDKYAFDTQSQRSLAFGVVDDMRGIGFPQLDPNSKSPKNSKPPTTPTGERRPESAPKKKPGRLDLSLLFPKPKPAAAPLLSPQRYTNSPSPVNSEFSVKPQPAKLTKPRSRGYIRASVKESPAPIPEDPPFPRKRVSTRRPAVDWFDVPLEQIIRLGETLEVDVEEENIEKSDRVLDHSKTAKEAKHFKPVAPAPAPAVTKPIQAPVQPDIAKNSSAVDSRRSSRTPSRVSNHKSCGSRGNENHHYRQPLPPSNPNRSRASLHTWQSEGDLRSAHQKPAGRLVKKKSSSTFHTKDLTKNSVLSLSSSEDEGENTDADEDYGKQLMTKVAPSRGPRDSFSTTDYVEPEICHAEAVVTTKGYGLTRLGRANSNVSSVSSESRSTQRRYIPSRADSRSPMGRSSVSTKMYGSSAHFDVPLIEEPEEQAEEVSNTRRPRLSSQSYSDLHSAKRRSRIIAVTRQEESLLEAMRLRNGRITPSIYNDIEPVGQLGAEKHRDSESVSAALSSPELIHTQFDTSFLRLSAAMRIPPLAAPNLAENESLIDKDSYLPTSDTEQQSAHSNNNIFTPSSRLSLAYSETPSSTSTMGHASPVTPTLLPIHRFSHQLAAPPPSHALPPLPDEAATRRHSRRRTDSSDAIVLEEGETEKLSSPPVYPLWAVKWGRDPQDVVAIAH
ncbi:conserved hypothetical protein [Talaromyces marneffei ATCC 18224]|uniref:Uncharacterized protein n=1 Tax=Talaromyces marneffei (strain ATCC 18224 / CBS 334.59 / QM 7333) TaxID=441960 RepID=B6QDJ3_TALMQ|nr:conserved hypothetical protein [Talaromyces marneffei ATCC 18224]